MGEREAALRRTVDFFDQLQRDLTAAQQEIERLREERDSARRFEEIACDHAADALSRAETAEAERDEEKARGDHLLQQLVSEGDRFVAARDQAEQLRAERDKLREALEWIRDYTGPAPGKALYAVHIRCHDTATAGLALASTTPAPVDEERDR